MRSIWFARAVLGAATTLLASIGLKYIVDPVGAVAPHRIVLGSGEAVTIMRVSGAVFLGIALALVGCVASERRLLRGLELLVTVAGSITAVRVLGILLDGPQPFTLHVLVPEVALVAFAGVALVGARRRVDDGGGAGATGWARDRRPRRA
jgi:uncharacterized protein DUF4345